MDIAVATAAAPKSVPAMAQTGVAGDQPAGSGFAILLNALSATDVQATAADAAVQETPGAALLAALGKLRLDTASQDVVAGTGNDESEDVEVTDGQAVQNDNIAVWLAASVPFASTAAGREGGVSSVALLAGTEAPKQLAALPDGQEASPETAKATPADGKTEPGKDELTPANLADIPELTTQDGQALPSKEGLEAAVGEHKTERTDVPDKDAGRSQADSVATTGQTDTTMRAREASRPDAPAAKAAVAHAVPPEQIAVHISRAAADGVDRLHIALTPDSLGQIDVDLQFSDQGRVDVVLRVDRPETLEIMQRDARQLVRALQDAGLQADGGSLSFQLRSGDQQQHRHPAFAQMGQQSAGGGSENEATVRTATMYLSTDRQAAGGLDIRV